MGILGTLASYYKIAVPVAILIVLQEELFSDSGSLNSTLRKMVFQQGETAEEYLARHGGIKKDQGQKYFDKLKLQTYKGEEGRDLPLKDFFVQHVTKYEAGLFEGLVSDWAALEKWDVNKPDGVQYLWQAFGKQTLLWGMKVNNQQYAEHRTSAQHLYLTFGKLMDAQHKASEKSKYKQIGGLVEGTTATLLLDQEVPRSIQDDIYEPKVTEQILDLSSVAMNVIEGDSYSILHAEPVDQLICTVAGEVTFHLLSGYQRAVVAGGRKFRSGEPNPPMSSPLDIREGVKATRVHQFTTAPGDCVFIPSYWWYQVETPGPQNGQGRKKSAITVDFIYDNGTSWVDLIMYGINNHLV